MDKNRREEKREKGISKCQKTVKKKFDLFKPVILPMIIDSDLSSSSSSSSSPNPDSGGGGGRHGGVGGSSRQLLLVWRGHNPTGLDKVVERGRTDGHTDPLRAFN